jgi:SAM-dependent methyltransferase
VTETTAAPSSFRDRAGQVFLQEGRVFRTVTTSFGPILEMLHDSGLYEELTEARLLVRHERREAADPNLCALLEHEVVPFISYPYEWCFSQLKDAALLTLDVQRRAIERGMSLRDASAYNVQFLNGRPILIDTLSLGEYEEGAPWIAYGQFCRHFLAPLALMAFADIRLGSALLRRYIDGVPLDLASALLPKTTKLKFGLLTHLHLHAKADSGSRGTGGGPSGNGSVSKTALLGIVDSLRSTIQSLTWKADATTWANYYQSDGDASAHNYGEQGLQQKEDLVRELLRQVRPETVWDLGANTGRFSAVAAEVGARVISWDIDEAAVERHYQSCREREESRILPLLQDLTNPSPSQGWASGERDGLLERGGADCVLALALIHHLAIGNNVPMKQIADFLAKLAGSAIVEFVPKQDSQLQRLLVHREDIFDEYTEGGFETAFGSMFSIREKVAIPSTCRILYLLERKS